MFPYHLQLRFGEPPGSRIARFGCRHAIRLAWQSGSPTIMYRWQVCIGRGKPKPTSAGHGGAHVKVVSRRLRGKQSHTMLKRPAASVIVPVLKRPAAPIPHAIITDDANPGWSIIPYFRKSGVSKGARYLMYASPSGARYDSRVKAVKNGYTVS